MSDSRLKPLMGRLGQALNSLGQPYMVIGGQAVNHHGRVRATNDIDLTVGISPLDWQMVRPVLEGLGLTPLVEDPQDWVIKTHVLPLHTAQTNLRIDISFTNSPYEMQAIERGEDVVINDVPVRFASVEDLIIHKIIAWRGVDQADVHAILLKNPDADIDDVKLWLSRFAEALELPLLDRLRQALREADMPVGD